MKFSETGNVANIQRVNQGPRIPPLPPERWPKEMGEALATLRPPEPRHPFPRSDDDRPKGLNVLGTLAHHPALTRAFNTFNGHVQFATTLSARQRELVILRVAELRRSDYEWAQHVVIGAAAGLTPAEIERVPDGPDAPLVPATEPRESAMGSTRSA